MISALFITPEFAVAPPRWLPGVTLALVAVFTACLLFAVPRRAEPAPAIVHAFTAP